MMIHLWRNPANTYRRVSFCVHAWHTKRWKLCCEPMLPPNTNNLLQMGAIVLKQISQKLRGRHW